MFYLLRDSVPPAVSVPMLGNTRNPRNETIRLIKSRPLSILEFFPILDYRAKRNRTG